MLTDDFEDGVVDETRWGTYAGEGAALEESAGVLRLTLPGGVSNASAGVTSRQRYDLRNRRLSVRLVKNFEGETGRYVALHAEVDNQNLARLVAEQGSLVAQNVVAGSYGTVASIPYDSAAHVWLGIREQDGTLYWESSADGQNWIVHGQRPVSQSYPVDAISIQLAARDSSDSTSSDFALLDDLNGGGAPGRWCPADTLTDDFDDGVRSIEWSAIVSGPCSSAEQGGRLTFHQEPGSWRWCEYGSARRYDLTGSSVAVELLPIPSCMSDGDVRLMMRNPDGNALTAAVGPQGLQLGYQLDGQFVDYTTIPYAPQEHRWLRISEREGSVEWETSADGLTWSLQFDTVPAFGLTDLETLLSTTAGAVSTGCDTEFDNLNLAPG